MKTSHLIGHAFYCLETGGGDGFFYCLCNAHILTPLHTLVNDFCIFTMHDVYSQNAEGYAVAMAFYILSFFSRRIVLLCS